MNNLPNCPKCGSEFTYDDGTFYICPECSNEWLMNEVEQNNVVKDINGIPLQNGDNVIVIKDLKIKGTSSTIKRGSKARNIRIVEDDGVGHDIECKYEGVGTIKLKSSLVKKGE